MNPPETSRSGPTPRVVMTVLSSIKAVGAFILLPIYQLIRALGNLLAGLILIVFAPVIHVAVYAGHAFFVIPYRIFAKFEVRGSTAPL